jgi:MYXO-CTERM domain-containing protein
MTFRSCRRTVLAVMVLLMLLVAVMAPALAQAPPGTPVPGAPPGQVAEPPPTRPETTSSNWGLLGLLGLLGFAGLLRRDSRRPLDQRDRADSP